MRKKFTFVILIRAQRNLDGLTTKDTMAGQRTPGHQFAQRLLTATGSVCAGDYPPQKSHKGVALCQNQWLMTKHRGRGNSRGCGPPGRGNSESAGYDRAVIRPATYGNYRRW